MRIKKQFLIFLILILSSFFLSMGYSMWIISEKTVIKPANATSAVVTKYLETACNADYTYNGTIQLPTSDKLDTSDLTFYYKTDTTSYTKCTSSTGPINAGTYAIKVEYQKSNKDGTIEDISIELENNLTIDQKEVELVWSNTYFQYDGSSHIPTATVSGLIEGDTCNVTVSVVGSNVTAVSAGTYTAKATIDNPNYYISESTQEFMIDQKIIINTASQLVVDFTTTSKTYNGKEQGPDIEIYKQTDTTKSNPITDATIYYKYIEAASGASFDNLEWSTSLPTNAGTYEVIVQVEKEGCVTYTMENSSFEYFTIDKKEIAIDDSYLNYTCTYNGETQGLNQTLTPMELTDVVEMDDISVYIKNQQKNAGTYTVEISLSGDDKDNYTLGSTSCTLKINQLRISFSDAEVDYDSSNRTWALMQAKILANVDFINATTKESITSSALNTELAEVVTVYGMNNGLYAYGSGQSIKNTTDNVVGSTYLVTYALNSNNSASSNYAIVESTAYLKYKTAMIGSTYYTIEDAIAASGAITFAGDNSSSTNYVLTCFTMISYYLKDNEQIDTFDLASRTMTVPYSGSTTYVYSALKIPTGITINCTGSTNITIDASFSAGTQTTIVGERGVIMNDGIIDVGKGVTITSYGYLKGTGRLNLNTGATAIDCIHTYDWPGGSTASVIYEYALPLNAWNFHNISCETKIAYDATYKVYLYVSTSIADKTATETIIASSGNCMFKGTSGYIMKSVEDKSINDSITSSNQVKGQMDKLEMYGTYTDAIFSISISVTGLTSISMKTSTSISCPVSYMNIYIKKGSSLTLSNASYLFMPGSMLEIESGASLSVSSGVSVSFETIDHVEETNSTSYSFYKNCTNKVDAKLVVNGTVTCNGKIGGTITSTSSGGTITFSSSCSTSFYSVYNGVGNGNNGNVAYKVVDFLPQGNIGSSSSIANFVSGTYTSVADDASVYWSGTAGTSTPLTGDIHLDAIYKYKKSWLNQNALKINW